MAPFWRENQLVWTTKKKKKLKGELMIWRTKRCEKNKTRGPSQCGLAICIKKYQQKKNYENSNISPCKNITFKIPVKETKIFQDIITL
jgi:hypothetical protein